MKLQLFLITCLFHLSPFQCLLDLPLGSEALDNFPLIDGHNDLPWNLIKKLGNHLENFTFDRDLTEDPVFGNRACDSCFTDLPRIKEGKLGAQFWVAYVDCNSDNSTFLIRTLKQIDVIHRLVKKYPNDMEFVTTSQGILDAFAKKKLASLIGLEGGHSIENSLVLLRQYYELGVRYMTLTHTCNLYWADSSSADDNGLPVSNLTEFGSKVVLEMNRLGMMVDLSHVSYNVMSKAIDVSKAPVIFSHSSAYYVHPHNRNVRDDILLKVKQNGGIVMVNFYSKFVGHTPVKMQNVINHINHIAHIAGVDHVGIGSDFDGVNSVPFGLEDVSKYPKLFDSLNAMNISRWTIENLEKLAGRNLIRVFQQVEKVRDEMAGVMPDESVVPKAAPITIHY